MADLTATVNCDALLAEGAARLRAAGIDSPRREARLLLERAIGVPANEIATGKIAMSPKAAKLFSSFLLRRCRHEPFAYITGTREFWSLGFEVSPDVLIPRPETETLIEAALREFPNLIAPLRVLDLGTGSGCLLLAFLSERANAAGIGVDRSPAAVRLAARNARALALGQRVAFVESRWASAISGTFDVIFANPPYIPSDELAGLMPEVAEHEPRLALDGGVDGLCAYREIAAGLTTFMAPGAALFVESGHGQAPEICRIFAAAKFQHQATVKDLAGNARCIVMRVSA